MCCISEAELWAEGNTKPCFLPFGMAEFSWKTQRHHYGTEQSCKDLWPWLGWHLKILRKSEGWMAQTITVSRLEEQEISLHWTILECRESALWKLPGKAGLCVVCFGAIWRRTSEEIHVDWIHVYVLLQFLRPCYNSYELFLLFYLIH